MVLHARLLWQGNGARGAARWGAGPRRVEEREGRDVAHFSFGNDQLHTTTIMLVGSQLDMCSIYLYYKGTWKPIDIMFSLFALLVPISQLMFC
jgi:hypothetical protein